MKINFSLCKYMVQNTETYKVRYCSFRTFHPNSSVMRPWATSTTNITLDKVHILGNPSIHPWVPSMGTPKSPGHHSYLWIVIPTLLGNQGTSWISLTSISPIILGTDHAWCKRAVCCTTLSVGHGGHIHLHQMVWLYSSRCQGTPARYSGSNIVIGWSW